MPYAPQYQPGQTQAPRGEGPALRPTQGGNWASAIGEGAQRLGQVGMNFAQAEDALQAHFDETQARRLAVEYQRAASPIMAEYGALQGQAAIEAVPGVTQRLADLRQQYLGQTSNQRMSEMLDGRLAPLTAEQDEGVLNHSINQQVQVDRETTLAEQSMAMEGAASAYLDPVRQAEQIDAANAALDRRARLMGWSTETTQQQRQTMLSQVYASSFDAMLNEDNPDLDLATAYFDAHQDEMTASARNAAMARIKEPLETRWAAGEFGSITSGLSPAAGGVDAGGEPPSAPSARTVPVANPTTTNTFAQHQARGSAGLDLAAPAGSAILPVAEGVVEEVGTGTTGGNFIRIRHADGSLTSYMHMQNRPQFARGQRIPAGTVIGTVGSTGHATGPHLHLEVRDADGNQIDPAQYLNGAEPLGGPNTPRVWDQAQIMAEVDRRVAAGTYTFEQGETVRGFAMRRMAQDEALLADREQDASRQASAWVLEHPEFTSIDQMPEALRRQLSPGALISYTSAASSNRAALAAPPQANSDRIIQLDIMRMSEPDRFIALDLGEYAGQMTRGELSTLATQQAQLRRDRQEGRRTWSPISGVNTAYNAMSRLDGAAHVPAQERNIRLLMEHRAYDIYRQNGERPLTEQDYQTTYRWATAEVRTRREGLFGETVGSNERYLVRGSTDIATHRNDIIRDYRASHGGALPSEAYIIEAERRLAQ